MRTRTTPMAWVERVLVAVGLACLGYYGYVTAEARQFQRQQAAAFESRLDSPPAAPSSRGGVLGLLDIPRLNISAPVVSGDDANTLAVAVGHLPDTPLPWETGNSALAAHRDGLFRPLRHIRVGDEIRVKTKHGEFAYRVRETKIVLPDDLSVLAPTRDQTLTLITCYPFSFVGNAPKRFIVHADRLSTERR